jgi:hypothetical protein
MYTITSKIDKMSYTIEPYKDRCIGVFGDTKDMKDYLTNLGGKFNPMLYGPDNSRRPGWIFIKSKKDEVIKRLADAFPNHKNVSEEESKQPSNRMVNPFSPPPVALTNPTKPKSNTSTEAKVEPKIESKPESSQEVKSQEVKADVKPDVKGYVKQESFDVLDKLVKNLLRRIDALEAEVSALRKTASTTVVSNSSIPEEDDVEEEKEVEEKVQKSFVTSKKGKSKK